MLFYTVKRPYETPCAIILLYIEAFTGVQRRIILLHERRKIMQKKKSSHSHSYRRVLKFTVKEVKCYA